jgi:hydrogenase maturation protease
MRSAPGSGVVLPILIIGYGNELRGDDAAGPRVAAAVAAMGMGNVRVLVRHQLTPELAEEMSQARAVIFTDAALGAERVGVCSLSPESERSRVFQAHVSSPQNLVGLAETLFGRCPPVWMVTVPARQVEFGAPLSTETFAGVTAAVGHIQELIRTLT